MPANCPFCETNTHDDGEENETCVRDFLTRDEALEIIIGKKSNDETIRVISNPRDGVLIGGDWSIDEVKELLLNCKSVERCDPEGAARKMKHGLAIAAEDGAGWFIETDEEMLKSYEALHNL